MSNFSSDLMTEVFTLLNLLFRCS